MKTLANKMAVPEAGEDILATLETGAMNSTAVIPVASVDEATLVANQIMAAGRPITSSRPVVFLVNSRNLYIYNGDIMRPANEIIYSSARMRGSGAWKTLKPSQGDVTILTLSLPAQPYDRIVDATAVLNIDVGKGDESVKGWIKAFFDINGTNLAPSRLDESSMEGTTIMGRLAILAGVAPKIRLQFRSYDANVQYYITTSVNTTIYAETRPIKMDIDESIIIDDPDD